MRRKKGIFFALAALISAAWIAWSNFALQTTYITAGSGRIPEAFDGYRIAQVSDLHDAEPGENHSRLVETLENLRPDLIVLTGDMVDSKRTDIENTLAFAVQAAEIAPTYYVNGNHEAIIHQQDYRMLSDGLRACGVNVMEDEAAELIREGEAITLIGLNDIGHLPVSGVDNKIAAMQQTLEALMNKQSGFTIALSHRPELIDAYARTNVDLVLCGHAHGGQFRLPILGGLVAPGQGILPEYDSGLYQKDNTQMIVSRGIGNSVIPIRFNTRPELILIELKKLPPE